MEKKKKGPKLPEKTPEKGSEWLGNEMKIWKRECEWHKGKGLNEKNAPRNMNAQ